MKPVICLDFDGIFNEYTGYDGDNIGRPREGIEEFLQELNKKYTVEVCSVRRYSKIMIWLDQYDLLKYVANVTRYKPKAVAYVDDRAISFTGDYKGTLDEIRKFRPYWER